MDKDTAEKLEQIRKASEQTKAIAAEYAEMRKIVSEYQHRQRMAKYLDLARQGLL